VILRDTTNASGVAVCRWTPTIAGQWIVVYDFEGFDQYGACSNESGVGVGRRPSHCTAEWVSPSQLFVGNHSLLLVTAVDGLNSSALAGRIVSFYEGATLLHTTFTNATGHATYSWVVAAPLGTRQFRAEVSETPSHEGWISAELSLAVRTTTVVTITSCTPQLYLGENGQIEVLIVTPMTDAPNGTASVYWDGVWQLDFVVVKGTGNTPFVVSYTDVSGEHLLTILFGHLDAPDVYAPCDVSFVVEVLPVFIPTLAIAVCPPEIADFRAVATISVDVRLTYRNGTKIHGLAVNVTLQLVAGDGTIALQLLALTDAAGSAHWILSTPQPGSYLFKVHFAGVRGFAPATAMAPLTIRIPLDLILSQALPLTLASLVIIVVGLLTAGFVFLRLQNRADQVARVLLGGRRARSGPPEPILDTIWMKAL
jgi:hypothetical protein